MRSLYPGVETPIRQQVKSRLNMFNRLEDTDRDLDPSWFAEQFGKVLATLLDVSRLAMIVQRLATCPLFDERELGRVI